MSNADEQAFPIPADEDHVRSRGLTKRELIAAMAMQGILMQERPSFGSTTGSMANVCAAEAVKCADALLAELAK